MLIRLGYDIQFETVGEVPIVTLLNVHPSREKDLREPDELQTDPLVKVENYEDSFGNHACRLVAPPGKIRFQNSTLIEDSGKPDVEGPDAAEIPIDQLPPECLALPYEQPVLRSGSVVEHCCGAILECSQGMEAGSGGV